jgi:SAM-dependent methyltransferase
MTNYGLRARHYDTEYAFAGDASFLASLITANVKTILEIPSGSGRNLWLTETKRKIFFVDREPEMIHLLSKKLARHNTHPWVRTICADLCNLDLGQCFDLILVPHDAFLMLTQDEEIESALQGLRRHLSPLGRLMIDVALLGAASAKAEDLPKCYDPTLPDGEWQIDLDRHLDKETRLVREKRQQHASYLIGFDFSYLVLRGEEEIDAYESATTLRRHTISELDTFITSAGLVITERFSDYDRQPFQLGNSRVIYLLEQRG